MDGRILLLLFATATLLHSPRSLCSTTRLLRRDAERPTPRWRRAKELLRSPPGLGPIPPPTWTPAALVATMKKIGVLDCVGAIVALASLTCASPSLLGGSSSRCTVQELVGLENAHVPEVRAADPSDAVPLQVAVFNIRSGFGPDDERSEEGVTERLSRIASALAAAGYPDVIGLNEVDFKSRRTGFVDQAELIARELGKGGHHYRIARGPAWFRDTVGREIEYGNALLVRHPVERVRQCPFADMSACEAASAIDDLPRGSLGAPWSWLSHEPRGVVFADFEWQGRTVRAIVTHLDPFSAQARETQAAQIIAGLVPRDGSVVLLGDMNAVPTQLTIDRRWFGADRTHDVLTSGRLFDVRAELGGEDPSAWGRWATYPVEGPRWGLDGVFVSADLTSTGLDVFGEGLSDHLGLVGSLLPVSDAAYLSERQKRHAERRQNRFARIERCDLPDRSEASFFSWLRNLSVAIEQPPVAQREPPSVEVAVESGGGS